MGTKGPKGPKQSPAVVRLTGDLDVFLKGKLAQELQAGPDNGLLVVDLTQVTFIDSAGLTVLIDAHKRATRSGGEVRLVVQEDQQVYRILQITGLTRMFKIFSTEAAALVP
ncbi:MAG: STAS domain-containing protein [Candidatus Eremiobacteraeota bacterium]|nr:STAS domain-containing protein [Candidatus Eremiobacteraeota bacterium]